MNLAFAIAALGGCGADLPPIEVTALAPRWAYNGEPTKITVTGRYFYPSVTASSFAEPDVESQFRAWVETDPPTEVDYAVATSLTTLEVQIPAGLEATATGEEPYDFTVESSDGNRDTLESALQVTPSRSAYLSASVRGDGTPVVGEWVTVDLAVMNLSGEIERESLEVNVSASSDAVEFVDGTLDHQAPIERGVQGTLLAGQGFVILTSSEKGTVTLTVSPTITNSIVEPATASITFGAGNIEGISVVVDDSAPIVAGAETPVEVTFLDENDQIVEDVQRDVTIYESCDADNVLYEKMSRPRTFQFSLRRATGTAGCAENSVIVRVDGGISGESEMLSVVPGPGARLSLWAPWTEATAGIPYDDLYVLMEDQFGNRLFDYATSQSDVSLTYEVDGDDATIGVQECGPFGAGLATCKVELWTAGPLATIEAEDGHGFRGQWNLLEVVPGAPFEIHVLPQLVVVQAGDDLQVRIWVTDEPENAVHIDASELHITDETEATLDCQYDGIDPTIDFEVHVFECRFTQVGTHRVVVDMASEGLYDFESSDIAVQNGELALISIDLGMTTVGAGVTFFADFVGTDAWGNPYVVQSDPDVDVRDASGTLTPTLVRLDATGRAMDQPMNVKRATLSNRLVATQDGTWLGSSPVFATTAGAFEELLVDVDGPAVSIDDPGIVLVSAVDEFGNAVGSYHDQVYLSSSSGLGNRVTITSWVDGRAAVAFPFDTLGVQDTLVADDTVNTWMSTPFDVVDFHCPAGPTANLEVGSGLPVRLCLLPGMGATSFDLSSSVAGAEPIEVYYYLRGDGSAYRTASSGWSTSWTQPGGYAVSGIVIDRDLCASESSGWVYAGYNDGQPVGPVDVEIAGSATSVHADGGFVGVDVRGWTCAGDWAIGGTLLATVDLGDLWVAGANRETGSGIELALDASGMGNIEWSMDNQPAGGIATFVAGVRSGAAHGEVTLDVDGDSSHPTVLEVSPVGTLEDDFDTIAILFSDPMQATSISTTSVLLSDPFGTEIVLDDLTLASSGPNAGRELVLDFPVQGGDVGAYTLLLTSDLRKAPGPYDNANTLDGGYGGVTGDFAVSFGGVGELAPDVVVCDPSTTLFRPDGDATGDDPFEADVVALDLVANGPAAWWLLEVFDLLGNRMLASHVDALDLDAGTIEWDGRSSDGTILDNGTYVVAVTAKDASWNEGAPCLANVTIDNLLSPVSE